MTDDEFNRIEDIAKKRVQIRNDALNTRPKGPKSQDIYTRGLGTMLSRRNEALEAYQKLVQDVDEVEENSPLTSLDKIKRGLAEMPVGGSTYFARAEVKEDEPGINPKDAQGQKKAPLHLVPPALRIYVSQAMADGAAKYGPYNWRDKPIMSSVYYSACARHLDAWWDGEEKAEDSGVHHLAHAAACLALLIDAIECEVLKDDRPIKGAAADLMKRLVDEKKDWDGRGGMAAEPVCVNETALIEEYRHTQNEGRAAWIAKQLGWEGLYDPSYCYDEFDWDADDAAAANAAREEGGGKSLAEVEAELANDWAECGCGVCVEGGDEDYDTSVGGLRGDKGWDD